RGDSRKPGDPYASRGVVPKEPIAAKRWVLSVLMFLIFAQRIFQTAESVTNLTLRLVHLAFRLQLCIASHFSDSLLNGSFDLLTHAFDSIFIHFLFSKISRSKRRRPAIGSPRNSDVKALQTKEISTSKEPKPILRIRNRRPWHRIRNLAPVVE